MNYGNYRFKSVNEHHWNTISEKYCRHIIMTWQINFRLFWLKLICFSSVWVNLSLTTASTINQYHYGNGKSVLLLDLYTGISGIAICFNFPQECNQCGAGKTAIMVQVIANTRPYKLWIDLFSMRLGSNFVDLILWSIRSYVSQVGLSDI